MNKRIIYFDYLRVFATFAVIIVHVSAQNWYVTNVNTLEWQIFNIYDSIVRWAVPVFVMISGALFLEKGYDLKKIYSKNILRMVTAFIFWGGVYAIVNGGSKMTILSNVLRGHYHMWFIPMIVGLYICIPIIHKIIESEEITKYFLGIAFSFSFLLPQIVQLVNDFGGERVKTICSIFNSTLNNMNLYLVLGYTGYFIGGFYLNRLDLSKRSRHIIYLLGIVGGLLTIVLDAYLAIRVQKPVENYYGYFCMNVLMESLAVFVWVKYNAPKCKKLDAIIDKLAQYSFGAYLVHVLVIEQLNSKLQLNTLSFNPIVSVPIIGIIVFIISVCFSAIINQIPFLKKYII